MPDEVNGKPAWYNTGLRWLWITLLFFIFDQVTKHLAVAYIGRGEVIEVLPFFNLVLRYNPGAAFSFLADAGGWQLYFFSGLSLVVSAGLIYWLYTLPATNRWMGVALTFILAGALGNLYDRLTIGMVVDFIDWHYKGHHWPAFNIADSVILAGALMMLLDGMFNPEHKQDGAKDKNDSESNEQSKKQN